ncbi:MAG: hypothetical protein ACTHM9_16335, partial [Gemmatimonadales bacterium]
MSDEPRLPPELEQLDREVGAIRFEPRASLGPEIVARVRRGEAPSHWRRRPWGGRRGRMVRAAAAAFMVLGSAM